MNMIKMITLVYRKHGMSREDFSRYWKEQHPAIFAKYSPGVRRYVQNHLVPLPGITYEGDGIVELWFDDIEAQKKFDAWTRTDEAKELADDADKFLDMGRARVWIVQEHVIKS
jgi:uncharacterized protein (TIGR02118 family)